jgi:hypothetical protein
VYESFAKFLLRVRYRYMPWSRRVYEDVMAADRPAQRPASMLEFADEVGTFQSGYGNHQASCWSTPYPLHVRNGIAPCVTFSATISEFATARTPASGRLRGDVARFVVLQDASIGVQPSPASNIDRRLRGTFALR